MASTQTELIRTLVPADRQPAYANAPPYFSAALEDAERLLQYASEFGIPVEDEIRNRILHARAVGVANWSEEISASVLASLSKLAARLKPISAESLKACCDDGTRPTVRNYWIVAICLAAVIVPFSLASFIASAISNTIKVDIATGNDLAVKLRAQLGPPGQPPASASKTASGTDDSLVIGELQQYAIAIRAIDARARQINALVLFAERDPFTGIRGNPQALHEKFQLPAGLPDFAKAADDRTNVYQDVRYFAQSVLDDVSFFYGAITACLLPVLYALLGTCAYLLRSFEQQIATKTFLPSFADSARFLIAGIGGGVVGLFNNFVIGQGASIPPLAIAFLVGYAVDVFFAFLETMLQTFSKTGGPAAHPPAPQN
ncbi:MAG TPA: hypothetical protein VG345_04455 [Bryobacteraceae bacterium]|nr:hypothetical protein [Bryobacteraceae bacterium]